MSFRNFSATQLINNINSVKALNNNIIQLISKINSIKYLNNKINITENIQ